MIRLIAYTLLLWLHASSVAADVRLSQPIANQLPPIAYVDQPFSFSLSQSTFSFSVPSGSKAPSSPPSILYSVTDLPNWLTFDPTTLTFTGTTPANDDGRRFSVPVTGTLQQGTATLGGNSSATDYLSIVVTDDPAPTVNVAIAEQFPKASSLGAKYMAAPTTIHLPLGWSFSIGLRGDTFAISTGANVYWSVALENGQPLPSWLSFSEDTYDFYGVAPVDVGADGLSLTVVVTGSNRPAHGGITQTFTLEVSPHALALPNGLTTVNATVGSFLQIPIPVEGLQMDGAALNTTAAVTVTANIPTALSWLTFTESNRTLTGTVPFTPYGNATSPTAVQVPLTYNNGNGTLLTVMQSIVIAPSVFTALVLPNVFMTKGQELSVYLAQYVRNTTTSTRRSITRRAVTANKVDAVFTPANTSQWLTYDQNALTLMGRVPQDWSNRVRVDLSSEGQGTNAASQASFYLAFSGDSLIGNPSPNAGGRSTSADSNNGKGLSHRKKVIIGASLGAVAGLALLIFLLCCCRRRKDDEEADRSRIHSPDRDVDGDTLTDKGRQWKKAIVVGRAGVGEIRTPSTVAVSPMPGVDGNEKGEKNEFSPAQANDLHSVVVVSPNGRRRDVMHEAEAPMQSRLIANLFTGGRAQPPEHRRNKANAAASKAGLGLSIGDVDPSDPFAGPESDPRAGRIRHVRSRESVNSHRSSWESDLFYEDAPSTQQNHSGDGHYAAQGEEADDVPRRRGKNLNVRHRTTHNSGSPAFVTPDVFAPSALPAVESEGQHLDRIGMSAIDSGLSGMTESHDSHAAAMASGRQEDARILKARIMQVQRHSPILHQGSRSPMLPQVAAARAYDTSNGAGAFDDAEDDEQSVGHANGSPSSKGKTRDNKSSAERKRNSTLSAVTVGSQHTAKNRATVENMPSPDPSIAAYDPRETVRQIGARPHTPPLQKIAAATSSTPRTPKRSSGATGSGGAASGLYLPCPMVNATIGYLLRFRLYPNVPPPMAGAPSSPGKRSGRTVRYELVMDDNRPHLAKYKGQWPAMLAEWLSIDTTTFEVEGVVPRATELEQLGDCDIALVSTTRISGNSSPDKRLSMASYDSRVSNDDGGEERTVVARAKLIFQNAAPRGFVPRHGQAF